MGRCRARKCGAPEAACRMTMASGRMAASVFKRVHQRLALGDAGARGRDGDGVGAQALGRDLEAGPRPRGCLVEQVHDHSSLQAVQPLEGLVLQGLKVLGAGQDRLDFFARQFFDSQESRAAYPSPPHVRPA